MSTPEILVLFDDLTTGSTNHLYAVMLQNLLGSSDRRVRLSPSRLYLAGQAWDARRTFYLGGRPGGRAPKALVEDVWRGAPVTWVDNHVEQLPLAVLGLAYTGRVRVADSGVDYRGYRYPRQRGIEQGLNRVEARTAAAEVHAWAVLPDGTRTPYALRSGAFWYIADNPFCYFHETDRYLVFADLLGPMLGDAPEEEPRAILRLEDVSAFLEERSLVAALDVLEECRIPFLMTVIPQFVSGGKVTSWAQSARVLAQIRRGERLGGRVFQHGYTHQSGDRPNPTGQSGTDWEFWDATRDGPLHGLNPNECLERVQRGRAVLTHLGLSPVGWTTPHYQACEASYLQFGRVYPLALERRQYFHGAERVGQFFPYPVTDVHGARLLPENLGFLAPGEPLDRILETARANRALRRPWASCYFHPYLLSAAADRGGVSAGKFRDLIRGIEALGYRFVDPLTVFDAESARPWHDPP